MILDKRMRFFVRHDIRFRPHYNHGSALPLRSADDRLDVETLFRAAMKADKAKIILKSKDVVRLTDIDVREDQKMIVFLFRRSDPDAATPIWEEQKSRKLRPADKKEDDALAVSAHLFVSLREQGGPDPTYAAVLEEVPGLGRTYVQGIFGDVLREAVYKYKDKHGEEKDTHTLIDFLGVKSDAIGASLEGASIPYVELIRPGVVEGLDSSGMIVPREQRMKLLLRVEAEKAIPLINRIMKWAPTENWADVRVRIDLPENRSRMVSVARENDAKDVLFVRSIRVDLDEDIPPCTETVIGSLADKAAELLKET